MRRLAVRMVCVSLMVVGASMVSAQGYPAKPIRIVASEPGGDNDFGARVIAQGIAPRLGQPVNVDNAPGGTGGAETVLGAPPDGYTLLSVGSQFWIEPLLHKTTYEPVRDFAPVIAVTNSPFVLYAHPSAAVSSVRELIALAKAKPGEFRYASGLSGASGHLATELFKAMAGVNLTRVEYKGGAAAMNATIAGEVQLIVVSISLGAPQVKAGRLKALGVTSARTSALLPSVPAIAETLPGYETKQVYGILARAGTPPAIVRQLNQEMARVLTAADVKERFVARGTEVVADTPEGYAAFTKAEVAKWGKLIRDIGIRAQ